MGRTEPSVSQPPASFRRDARAKKAKATINQVIPSLLSTHPRARRGIDAAEVIINPPAVHNSAATSKKGGHATGEASTTDGEARGPKLTLQVADTLVAARDLTQRSPGLSKGAVKEDKVAILNMASPLSPGGGFLNGATSQEESLCMRTTLLPSLKDEYYRLPELGAIYTPDVLVFRNEHADEVLEKKDRWFVDCVTAAMLRGPETAHDEAGRASYEHAKDRELVTQKMKMVLRICQAKGAKKVVLGAWGCGAYGNPVNEVATAWRKVLLPKRVPNSQTKANSKSKGKSESWDGIEDVVFAIKDPGMAESFMAAFGDGLVREQSSQSDDMDTDDNEDPNLQDTNTRELQARIQELEQRIETTTNPQVKKGLRSIIAGLTSRVPQDTSPKPGEDSPSASGDDDEISDPE